ncbi:MAG: DUF454 family protein [Candidatus Galacturonibacter soehngenii]|nr:DUF454 family protein [Candidatus Galacturonibacter soehngenii]
MKKIINSIYVVLAFVFMVIGVIGIVLPILPTTPFLLLSLILFAKGSNRFHKWFMGTWLYKRYVETYTSKKVLPMRIRIKALATVSIFFAIGFVFSPIIYAKVIIVIGWLAHVYFFLLRKPAGSKMTVRAKKKDVVTKSFLFFLSVCLATFILEGGWSDNDQTSHSKVKASAILEDGNYSIPISLWHATNDVASAGNEALYQTGKLIVKEGQATLNVHLKGMSIYGMSGYLMQLNLLQDITFNEKSYPIRYELLNSTLISTYSLIDEYNGPNSTDNVSAGKPYPKVVSVPVTLGTEYIWAQVYVPVMGSLGFGEQICRIKLDYLRAKPMTSEQLQEWETFETSDKSKDDDDDDNTTTLDTTVLKAKIDEANALLIQTDVYTQTSLFTLQAAITTAQSAYDNALATQLIIDAQVTALQGAMDALIKKSTEVLDKNNLPDGKYNVNINLWHFTNDTKSMGNAAMNPLALLTVKNNVYTMEFSTKPMNLGTITACLQTFEVEQTDGIYAYATIKAKNNSLDGVEMPSVFSFVLPSKEEYVNVRIDPKVEIVGRVLDARLKISWDTLVKVNDDSTVIEDTEPVVVTEGTPAVDLTDKKTKVRVTAQANVLPEGVSVKVLKITSGTNYQTVQTHLESVATLFTAYDITLYNSSSKVIEPSGMVTVYIPIPDDYNTSTTAVYRINDSSKTKLTSTIENGYAVFETNSFSIFTLADTSTVKKTTLPTIKKSATLPTKKKSTTPTLGSKKTALAGASSGVAKVIDNLGTTKDQSQQPIVVQIVQNDNPIQMNHLITIIMLGASIFGSILITLIVVGFILVHSLLRRK